MEIKKSVRGGKRPNAGRKSPSKAGKGITISVFGYPEDREDIVDYARRLRKRKVRNNGK